MSSKFGDPITDSVPIAGGEVTYYQRGCIFKRASLQQPIEGLFQAPLLGRPAMISTDKPGRLPLTLSFSLSQEQWDNIGKDANRLRKLWQDRLVLQRVEEPSETIHLAIEIAKILEPDLDLPEGPLGPIPSVPKIAVQLKCQVPGETALRDRTLYNVGFRLPNGSGPQQSGKIYPLAPHAIYTKRAWDSFGFIHATDLHVSRRLEGFRRKLKQANRPGAAREFNNFNDNVRDMIRYANDLHRNGMLDFVMATGDLVDYKAESRDHRSGGNFALLEELVLGQAPSMDEEGSPNEELCVPIFTTLGNHDYRANSYELYFTVDIPIWKDKTFSYSSSLNLKDAESKALQGDKKLKVNRDRAREMVEVEEQNPYYFRHISAQSSYVVELGQHRIVMIDSKYDLGVQESDWDAIALTMGWSNEDQRIFAAGSPNSLGFKDEQLALVRRALNEAGTTGLVIVGIHAPPLNPKGNEYPHYFRETEHPTLDENRRQVESFLRRQSIGHFHASDPTDEPSPSILTDWPRTGTRHFKKGGIGNLLDFGISKGETEEFLQLCVGEPPVDLVLCGHGHRNVEYRLKKYGEDQFYFFTDFYTENPTVYYPTYDYRVEWTGGGITKLPTIKGDRRPIFIRVRDQVPLNQVPTEIPDPDTGELHRQLDIPPYDKPLDRADDAEAWWQAHRPLIIQTAGLGPIESWQRETPPQPTFQGFRVISVDNNIISKIHCVLLADLKGRMVYHGQTVERCSWLEPVLNMMMS